MRVASWFRRSSVAVVIAGAALLSACSDYHEHYYDGYQGPACGTYAVPAVVVRFLGRDGLPIDTAAGGTLVLRNAPVRPSSEFQYDAGGNLVGAMRAAGPATPRPGTVYELAGGWDQPGLFDVHVATANGERYDWANVNVQAAACGPATVTLDASVAYP